MNPIASAAGQFISAVRRRFLLVRIAESIAAGIVVASATGLLLLPVLWYRNESALPMAVVLLAAGLCLGLIRGIARRPTRLQAAIEADHQLGLHDLLGTIASFNKSHSTDDWQLTLAAYAENRCRTLHPSAIIASRLGLRAWAGVGVLGGLLLTCALLTAKPTNATAASSNILADSSPDISSIPASRDSLSSVSRPPGPGGTDSNSSRGFPQDHPDNSTTATASSPSRTAGANSSTGAGIGTTHERNSALDPLPILRTPAESFNEESTSIGRGIPEPNSNHPGQNYSVRSASPAGSTFIAPWSSSHWSADVTAANAAIDSGQVPPDDRDLVRDYFQRN
jgi:hypothetical protein